MDQAAALPGGYAGQAARRGHFDRDHPNAEISRDTPDMDDAAQVADGISGGDVDRALGEAEGAGRVSSLGPAAPQAAGEGSAEPKVTLRRELFLMRQNWGSAYAITAGDEPGTAWARRRDGLGEPMQGTPAEVTRLIAADYGRHPVPRDVAP